jgi:hypothetical protein
MNWRKNVCLFCIGFGISGAVFAAMRHDLRGLIIWMINLAIWHFTLIYWGHDGE